MLAPTHPPHTITHSQSRPLRENLVLGLVVIGMMILGTVFLYFATDGLLWLEGYLRDQVTNAGAIRAAKLLTKDEARRIAAWTN
jgi:hypothetical protein